MSIEKQKLYNEIETLPEELASQVIDFIEYLKLSHIDKEAPDSVTIKSKKDLRERLQKGMDDIKAVLKRAIVEDVNLKLYKIKIDDEALSYFADACGGDVRSALNGLEIGVITTPANKDNEIVITKEIAAECLQSSKPGWRFVLSSFKCILQEFKR